MNWGKTRNAAELLLPFWKWLTTLSNCLRTTRIEISRVRNNSRIPPSSLPEWLIGRVRKACNENTHTNREKLSLFRKLTKSIQRGRPGLCSVSSFLHYRLNKDGLTYSRPSADLIQHISSSFRQFHVFSSRSDPARRTKHQGRIDRHRRKTTSSNTSDTFLLRKHLCKRAYVVSRNNEIKTI